MGRRTKHREGREIINMGEGDIMGFFCITSDYLTEKRVRWFVPLEIVLGAVALGLAQAFMDTKWEVIFAVVSIVMLVDACLLRYCYEIKKAVGGCCRT